jgi:hypothetical protein
MACGVSVALPAFIFSLVVAEDGHGPEARGSSQRLSSPRTAPKCRGVSRGTHSRVAERTRLFPVREYSGKY